MKKFTIGVFVLLMLFAGLGNITAQNDCLTPVDITVALDANGNVSISPDDVVVLGSDCSLESLTVSPNTFTFEDLGPQTVTITGTTASQPTGNYASVPLGIWDAYSGNDILSGDINGDGYADIVSNRGWYRNNSGNSFSRIDMYSYDLAGPQLGDLDGDGDLDLIASHGVYHWNETSGSYQFVQSLSVNMSTSRVTALADFDNDGDLDWYVTTYYWGENGLERLFINDGTGHFTLGNSFAIGAYQMTSAAGDFDEDGEMDVVIAGYYDVYVGINDGAFANGDPVNFNYTSIFTNGNSYIRDIKAEDFNGDGHLDLIFAGYAMVDGDMGLIMMLGNGDGTFQSAQVIETYGALTWDIDVNDFEGDGDLDIVTVVNGINSRLYTNDGSGNFSTTELPFVGAYWNVMKVKLDDYNNDGVGDYAKSNEALITEWAGGEETVTATVTVVDDMAPSVITQDLTVSLDENGTATITPDQVNNGSSDNVSIESLTLSQTTFDCDDISSSAGGTTALDFDGSNDVVAVGYNPNITDISNNGFTMEAWIKNASPSGVNSILRKAGDYDLYLYGGRLYAEVWLDGTSSQRLITGPAFSATNVWTHIAFTWDGTIALFYINGVAHNGSYNGYRTIGSNANLGIGASLVYNQTFNGQIDEVRIWNVTRTATEIQDNYLNALSGSESGLVAYFDFEEGSGNIANDKSTSAVNGTLTNMDNSDWVAGNPNFQGQSGVLVTLTAVDGSGNTSSETAIVTVVDDIAPVAVGNDITVNLAVDSGYELTEADLAALSEGSSDNCSFEVSVSSGTTFYVCDDVGSTFPVEFSVTDGSGNSSVAIGNVTVADPNSVCNAPPVALAQDITLSVDANCEANAVATDVDNGSYDPDGDAITMTMSPEGPYGLGDTEVTLTVSDGDLSSTATATITVVDDTAPVISVSGSPITLWPPNHQYATVSVSDFVQSVSDNCSGVDANDVVITSVSSDEAEDANGNGDGNTLNDIVIADNCMSVDLRKERAGNGNGRVYTINVELIDAAGNTGTASFEVHVPKNKNGSAINDGSAYSVDGNCGSEKSSSAFSNDIAKTTMKVYPNPTLGNASLEVNIEVSASTVIEMYNSYGKKVAEIFNGYMESGRTVKLNIEGNDLPKGIYYIRLNSGNTNSEIVKLIITG